MGLVNGWQHCGPYMDKRSIDLKFTLIIIFIVCLMFYSKIYSHIGFRHMLFIRIEYNGNCLFFTSECFLHLSMVVFEMELLRWFITILQYYCAA